MKGLEKRLAVSNKSNEQMDILEFFRNFENELNELKVNNDPEQEKENYLEKITELEIKLMRMKEKVLSAV